MEARRGVTRRFRFWALVLAAYGILFALFPDHSLTGDGKTFLIEHTRDLQERGTSIWPDEALDDWLHQVLILRLGATRESLVVSYRILSLASGLLFILFCLLLAKELFPDDSTRRLFSLHLLCLPPLVQFMGTIEAYGFLNALVAGYLWASVRSIRRRSSMTLPALLGSLAFCFHVSAGWLFPSLVFLSLWHLRNEIPPRRLRTGAFALAAFVAPVVFTVTVLWTNHIPPWELPVHSHAVGVLSVRTLEDGSKIVVQYQPFRDLASPAQWMSIGVTVRQLLLIPLLAALVGLAPGLRRRPLLPFEPPINLFLVLVNAFAITFIIVWRPLLGPHRDWTLFSFTVTGVAVLAFGLLLKAGEGRRRGLVHAVSLVFLAIQIVFVGGWIVENHRSPELSRVLSARLGDPPAAAPPRAFAQRGSGIRQGDHRVASRLLRPSPQRPVWTYPEAPQALAGRSCPHFGGIFKP